MYALKLVFASSLLVSVTNLAAVSCERPGEFGSSYEKQEYFRVEDDTTWTLIRELYDINHEEYKAPQRVHELLLKLDKLYEPLDEEETNWRKSDVSSLLQASHIDQQMCTESKLKSFKAKIDDNIHLASERFRRPALSLESYLKHQLDELAVLCTEIVVSGLHDSVNKMAETSRSNMVLLADSIAATRANSAPLSPKISTGRSYQRPELIQGLLEFVRKKSDGNNNNLDSTVDSILSRAKLEQLYRGHVLETCQDWMAATGTMDEFVRDFNYNRLLTDDETRWIDYRHLCSQILFNSDLVKAVHGELARRPFKNFKLTSGQQSGPRVPEKLSRFGGKLAKLIATK